MLMIVHKILFIVFSLKGLLKREYMKESGKKCVVTPFAGIILFRFNGYFSALCNKAPRERSEGKENVCKVCGFVGFGFVF